jgi:hypothetical protein
LGEDRSDVVIGVPGGRVFFVGEVPGEESFYTVVDVVFFEENVVKYTGERDVLVGASDPFLSHVCSSMREGLVSVYRVSQTVSESFQ